MEITAQLEDQEPQEEQAHQLALPLMDQLDYQEVELPKPLVLELTPAHQELLKAQPEELHMDNQAHLCPHMVNQEADTALELLVNQPHLKSEELQLEVEVELHTDNPFQATVNQVNSQEVVLLTLNQAQANHQLEVSHTDKEQLAQDHMDQLVDTQEIMEALESLELLE